MQIRAATLADLAGLAEIDGTVNSSRYLHLEQSGEGLAVTWRIEERAAREKLIEPNRLSDEASFAYKQITNGADEGAAVVIEMNESLAAALAARVEPQRGTLHIVDLRVDYDLRRQGLGTALVYQIIQAARERELRAVSTETRTNNQPAAALLAKCGFELSGVDMRRHTNHDMVKESATVLWYAPLD
jgi:ribosomal protein S18 acetylase RimI-like enzyme